MKSHRRMYVAICVSVASLLVLCGRGQAASFTPQLERPGEYYVEGFVDMWVDAVDPANTKPPFGIDENMASDGVLDFSAGVIARFDAPSTAADNPVDGLYDAEFDYFRLTIGDTTWDQTMPGTTQFQVTNGIVNGCLVAYTHTMPAHPDLSFALPTSPGTWTAWDKRGDVDLGVVIGTYELRDGIIPEPATACLLVLGGLAIVRRRRK